MEFNIKALKYGLITGGISAILCFLNAVTSFNEPPALWPLLKLSVVPALLVLFTTLLQYCPKPTQTPKDRIPNG